MGLVHSDGEVITHRPERMRGRRTYQNTDSERGLRSGKGLWPSVGGYSQPQQAGNGRDVGGAS